MNDLLQRRGRVKISGDLLFKNPDKQILKALFSNFYPVSIEIDHLRGWNRSVIYYGYSMLFEITSEGQVTPEYDFTLQTDDDGFVSLKSVNKVS